MSTATQDAPEVGPDLDALALPFAGARVLITGGLGFIGSSLALPLARAGLLHCPDDGAPIAPRPFFSWIRLNSDAAYSIASCHETSRHG